jgi:hypothetical protein
MNSFENRITISAKVVLNIMFANVKGFGKAEKLKCAMLMAPIITLKPLIK